MVRKKNKKKVKKGFVFPQSIDPIQFGKSLKARQKRTLMRVIESQASLVTKERAKQMLVKLK